MNRHGWWIAAAGALIAVAAFIGILARGPDSDRAPAQQGGASRAGGALRGDPVSREGSTVRVTVEALPAGSSPEWTVELRDAGGALHTASGVGETECALGPAPAGRSHLVVRARGFVGATRRLEIEASEVAVSVVLRRFGSVAGRLQCDGLPVGGAIVRLSMPRESLSTLMDLAEEDRVPDMAWSAKSDGEGRYRFERVPPAEGFTLVAGDFDHAPVEAGPFDVRPGEETVVDVPMRVGGHIAGRIVDSRGVPCAGATVHVYVQQRKPSVVSWVDEARARTDDDGRFDTPALPGTEMRMLKAWVAVGGVQQIIQHETEPPERGTKDVGTLAPLPGVVLLEAESMAGKGPFKVTVGVTGDPPGVGPVVIVNDLELDAEGRARVAGFPVGDGVYSVFNGDGRAVIDGKFRATGADIVVKIPPFGEPPSPAPTPKEKLTIDVPEGQDVLVALLAGDDIAMWRRVRKDDSGPVVEPVGPGTYTLHISAGDRYGRQEITQVEGQDLRVSAVPDRIGRTVTILVLQDGKPVPRAKVGVRGFRAGSRGLRMPWAESGEDGRALLRGVPPDVSALTATIVSKEGFGRTYSLELGEQPEVTVDLAQAPGEGR